MGTLNQQCAENYYSHTRMGQAVDVVPHTIDIIGFPMPPPFAIPCCTAGPAVKLSVSRPRLLNIHINLIFTATNHSGGDD